MLASSFAIALAISAYRLVSANCVRAVGSLHLSVAPSEYALHGQWLVCLLLLFCLCVFFGGSQDGRGRGVLTVQFLRIFLREVPRWEWKGSTNCSISTYIFKKTGENGVE